MIFYDIWMINGIISVLPCVLACWVPLLCHGPKRECVKDTGLTALWGIIPEHLVFVVISEHPELSTLYLL